MSAGAGWNPSDVWVESKLFPGTCSRCGQSAESHHSAERYCFPLFSGESRVGVQPAATGTDIHARADAAEKALRIADELIEDLLGYACQSWDWKYGDYWRGEQAKVRAACVRGNCSLRPLPSTLYDYERAMLEAVSDDTREYIKAHCR